MIVLWVIIFLLSRGPHPDHTAWVIQNWENHHVLATILILVCLG